MLSTRFCRFFGHIHLKTIRKTVESAGKQRLPGLAAEMAYNTMLGLFPAILAVLTAIGLFEPLQTTFVSLIGRLSEVAPSEVSYLIQGFAREISESRNKELFSLSFAIALWASSGALSAAMTALDQIHQVPLKRRRPFWKARIIAIGLTVGMILLLMIASALVFISEWLVDYVIKKSDSLDQSGILERVTLQIWGLLLAWPLPLGIMSSAFAFVYRFGPSRWISDKPILPGAVLAAVLWAVLSNLFRLYVSNFGDYNRAYGAVGAVIVLMLWLYLSSLVLLLGDQLNVTVGEAMQQQTEGNPPRIKKRELFRMKIRK
jgi:membrane protein